MARRLPVPITSGAIALPPDGGAYVYRAYCRCDDLLYVGVADDLFNRVSGHQWGRKRSPWTSKAVRIEWDLYATRADAAMVEEHLIRTEDPTYNVLGRGSRKPRWQDLPWPAWRDAGGTPQERLLNRARAFLPGDRL